MLGLFATVVFATAGCSAAAVIGSSVRNALPALRKLAADRRALAEDRVYLFTMIDTPLHDGTPAPAVMPARIGAAGPVIAINPRRRRAALAAAAVAAPVPLRAAA